MNDKKYVEENEKMKWEENVRKVVPYVPGEQPKDKNVIKLNTNENPYPPAPGVEKLMNTMTYQDFRLYPDTDATDLTKSLAKFYGVRESQIFIGVGSDDVLGMAFMTFFNNAEKPVLFPDITYSFYDVWADLYKIPYKQIPLDENFRIRKEDYLVENGGIIFPNPNAPTGVLESVSDIEEIVKANPESVVIIDEAYIDFGGQSCLPLVEKYENLMVVQTFSKSRSMAGMRIGFAIANEKMIDYLKAAKFSYNSYTMNMPSLIMGVASVDDKAYFEQTCQKIIATREWFKKEMEALGFDFTDSYSNFLFAEHKSVPAKEIFDELKEKKIYVRYWNKARISNRLRITIGTDEQMQQLIEALKEIV